MITNKKGQEKVPDVSFYAEDSTQGQEDMASSKKEKDKADEEEGTDAEVVDGKLIKTGKISKSEKASLESDLKDISVQDTLRGGPGEGGIETYSGLGHESQFTSDQERKFVRWSSSTEIGDFIRDAARGKEFAIKIEGSKKEIRVGVPSFNDRTHYLRVRLRKTSHILHDLASLKKECDDLAHKSAQRLAMGGFGILVAWWATIYHITFQTDIGWDGAEPITVRASLFLTNPQLTSPKPTSYLNPSHWSPSKPFPFSPLQLTSPPLPPSTSSASPASCSVTCISSGTTAKFPTAQPCT